MSIYGIHMHLAHYSQPRVQRHIIRVLWMVPIYASNAWLALLLGLFCKDKWTSMPDAMRSCYEAYTIYSFYRYLVAHIETKEGMPLAQVVAREPPMKHLLPLRLTWWTPKRGWFEVYSVRPWIMGRQFVSKAEAGIMNYVIVKPMTTIITVIIEATDYSSGTDMYGENSFNPHKAFPYIAFVDNASQLWALYCLILVYYTTHDVMTSRARPTLKFMCVKGVVFATFWQGLILALAVSQHWITDKWYARDCVNQKQRVDVVAALQDTAISFEMLVSAFMHAVAFPSREYRDPTIPSVPARTRFKRLFDVSDVYEDVTRHSVAVTRDVATAAVGATGAAAGAVIRGAGSAGRLVVGKGSWGEASQGLASPLLDDDELDAADFADAAPWESDKLGAGSLAAAAGAATSTQHPSRWA